jgi:Cdc6-like AAA superfamily ATPase
MNFLITGVKGVGKTTMALGIVNYLKAHPKHGILGVYVDCEDPKYHSGDKISATLCQHVRNQIGDTAFEALSINPDMDIVDLVSKVQDAAKLSFFIVVDEIQALYVPHGTPGRLEQQSLVYSFYKLGKGAWNVATILTGSSRKTSSGWPTRTQTSSPSTSCSRSATRTSTTPSTSS